LRAVSIRPGNSANNVVNGGRRRRHARWPRGNDTFVFAPAFGNDTVQNFDANPAGGQDLLKVSALGITAGDFATRVVIADVGTDTLVTVDGVDTIRLLGIGSATTVTTPDFILVA
jgi:hypothetical protein